jgi:molybdopterin converting factor small subunit
LILPSIQVEFFGVVRRRAEVSAVALEAVRLRDVVAHLREHFPALAELCVQDDELAPGWLLNVNGAGFTRDLNTNLNDGDNVLLIPADAGG